MAADRKLIVQIVGDSKSAERAFARVNKAATGFGSRLRSLGKIAAVGVGSAFVGLGLLLRKGFKEFMEGQTVMAQTRAVLKSTGKVANVTAKDVDRLAGSLSRMTGIDDEVIAAGENMLLTFTNVRNGIGKNQKIFDQATRATLDLSVATGKDMTTAAIMVGKALNDVEVNSRGTITGWSALRRVGVMITADMMAQAAAFIKAGKPMKAQQLLLRELNTEFGGSAKAFGTTLPGAFAKFRNALDEVTGAFAQGLAPVVQRVANILATKMADPAFVARVRELGTIVGVKLLGAFKATWQWLNAHWPEIQSAFFTTVTLLKQMLITARQFAAALGPVLKVAEALNKFYGGSSKIAKLFNIVNPATGGVAGFGARKLIRKGIGAVAGGNEKAPGARPKPPKIFEGAPGGRQRQHGGRVMRGSAYTVGERGQETFVPGNSGRIMANGGGGITIAGPIYVTAGNVRQLIAELERVAKRGTAQQRGRWGGQNLALG